MNVGERKRDILRAIRQGNEPDEIDPSVTGAYETDFYNRHREIYDRMKKQGVDFVWSHVSD